MVNCLFVLRVGFELAVVLLVDNCVILGLFMFAILLYCDVFDCMLQFLCSLLAGVACCDLCCCLLFEFGYYVDLLLLLMFWCLAFRFLFDFDSFVWVCVITLFVDFVF